MDIKVLKEDASRDDFENFPDEPGARLIWMDRRIYFVEYVGLPHEKTACVLADYVRDNITAAHSLDKQNLIFEGSGSNNNIY